MFKAMCPEKQQTSDNLIIVEIFDKRSFSGILRGFLSHLRSRVRIEVRPRKMTQPGCTKMEIPQLLLRV